MDRDEFMELVYETFADEPDNVLANGIIEAADAYAEHEKTQLSCEGTTKDAISRQAAIDAVNNAFDRETLLTGFVRSIAVRAIRDMPTIQPEPTDEQKSCEYCHEDSDGYTRPIEKNCHAYIRFGMNGWELDLKAKGWHGEAQIKFCPMCGRKLQGGR